MYTCLSNLFILFIDKTKNEKKWLDLLCEYLVIELMELDYELNVGVEEKRITFTVPSYDTISIYNYGNFGR